jgi:hypothetical protein
MTHRRQARHRHRDGGGAAEGPEQEARPPRGQDSRPVRALPFRIPKDLLGCRKLCDRGLKKNAVQCEFLFAPVDPVIAKMALLA